MTWHTVHHGSPDGVNLAAGFLDGFGIALRVVDPHEVEVSRDRVTSASSALRVQVRDSDAEAAAGLLADTRPGTIAPKSDRSLDRLGVTIRACAVSTVFAPLGLLLAPSYLVRSSRAETRPSEHGWNLAGIAACVPASVFNLFAFQWLIES